VFAVLLERIVAVALMYETWVDTLIKFDILWTKDYFRILLRMRLYAKCNTRKSYANKLT
jgi:hypothetical protein